jgi:hypothetical protein
MIQWKLHHRTLATLGRGEMTTDLAAMANPAVFLRRL